MNKRRVRMFLPLCLAATQTAMADGAFYGDPPDATHPWAVHDLNRPQPPRVEPGSQPGQPPSDAVVLFDGTPAALARWESAKTPGSAAPWRLVDGVLEAVPGSGDIRTRELYGDCQLHLEWSAPTGVKAASQGRSNSGVFFAGDAEVQILDNFNNPTYADGFAGSVYGVNPPAANPLRPPGQWQTYDIIFRRPVHAAGKLLDPGRLTVMVNGVVVQDATPLEGGGGHKARSHDRPFPAAAPLRLQDHGNPVRFRNIWLRKLPARAVEGGQLGALDPAAATAVKRETAAAIRADAAKRTGTDRLLRRMESLCYDADPATVATVTSDLAAWTDGIAKLPATDLPARQQEILRVFQAIRYLDRHALHRDQPGHLARLEKLIRAQGWNPGN